MDGEGGGEAGVRRSTLVHQAWVEQQQRGYDDAASLYRTALERDPDDVGAWQGLARLMCLRGNGAAIVPTLEEVATRRPDSTSLLTAIADIHLLEGRFGDALQCYERVLERAPDDVGAWLGLARCLDRRPMLALRLRDPGRVSQALDTEGVDPELVARAAAVLVRRSGADVEDPLLLRLLLRALLVDVDIERAMTSVRRDYCLAPPPEPTELALAISAQCRRNEFAWPRTAEEEGRLATAPAWVRRMYGPDDADTQHVSSGAHVPTLGPAPQGTSLALRELYEAHPYPMWHELSTPTQVNLDEHLRLLVGDRWEPPDFLRRPRLLVVGCGTGRDLFAAARAWRPRSATGIDLSRTSLAHAARMADQLGIPVELYQADLLQLDAWDREFDVVVCTGVLHHLDDPMAGWRALLRRLRPGGVMLIGLYSETARRGIVAAQEEVRRLGQPPTAAGLRAARAHLLSLPADHAAWDCAALRDFYHVGGCRDLLMHVQERRFTLPAIAAMLEELGMRFVAFEVDGAVRQRFRTLFGADDTLAAWASFERLYPSTFLGMYQFWAQARDEPLSSTPTGPSPR